MDKQPRELMAEKLDEIADISTYWARERTTGRISHALSGALIAIAREVVLLADEQSVDVVFAKQEKHTTFPSPTYGDEKPETVVVLLPSDLAVQTEKIGEFTSLGPAWLVDDE